MKEYEIEILRKVSHDGDVWYYVMVNDSYYSCCHTYWGAKIKAKRIERQILNGTFGEAKVKYYRKIQVNG